MEVVKEEEHEEDENNNEREEKKEFIYKKPRVMYYQMKSPEDLRIVEQEMAGRDYIFVKSDTTRSAYMFKYGNASTNDTSMFERFRQDILDACTKHNIMYMCVALGGTYTDEWKWGTPAPPIVSETAPGLGLVFPPPRPRTQPLSCTVLKNVK